VTKGGQMIIIFELSIEGESMSVKTVLTGVKPTGEIHLGNYLGAIKPAIEMSLDPNYQNFLFIADYHAFTAVHDAKELQESIYHVACAWLALGVDPIKVIFYRQSDVKAIFEINWILNCMTSKGLMNRAHAYKALVQQNIDEGRAEEDHNIGMGIYSYPILMAADILSFDADYIPVGKDQVQHIEIARDIAQRINHHFGDVLKLPAAMVPKTGHSVVGLDGRKMSKSYGNTIPLFLPEKKLQKLINRITTDSTPPEAPKDPAQSNIFEIYSAMATPEEIEHLRKRYQVGISWGEAKAILFEKVNSVVAGPRAKYEELINNKPYIDQILQEGAKKASVKAEEVLARLRTAIGISR